MNQTNKYYKEYYKYILKGVKPSSPAKEAVFDIISDLTDRRGLRQEFDGIDGETQEEIIDKWIKAIEKAFKTKK